jgi:hypothetical protein
MRATGNSTRFKRAYTRLFLLMFLVGSRPWEAQTSHGPNPMPQANSQNTTWAREPLDGQAHEFVLSGFLQSSSVGND